MTHIVPRPVPAQRVQFVDDQRQITAPWFLWLKHLIDDVLAAAFEEQDRQAALQGDDAVIIAFLGADR